MISFPNAKINLGLYVTEKRQDGYHNIESCLYPIPWRDVLEIIPSRKFSFEQTGLPIPGKGGDNLCVKAYEMLQVDFDLAPVAMHLHKVIPMGAGLGGGSSDAAFAIKMLNTIFELGMSADRMKSYAAKLGSDCPFFINNVPALASGTGTDLTLFDLDLSQYYIGLIFPGVHMGTKEAYSGLTPKTPEYDLQKTLATPPERWQGKLLNDFEPSAIRNQPKVAEALKKMEQLRAAYFALSGSGSTVFGLFVNDLPKEEVDHFEKLT